MEWIQSILMEHSSVQAVVIIALIIAAGLGLGKIRVKGISLGVTWVFFAGIFAGHIGLSIDPAMLAFAQNFGLVLFVYELGLQVGWTCLISNGHWVEPDVGLAIAEGLKAQRVRLPDADAAVLLRWAERTYGF